MGIADRIIQEPSGGAHRNYDEAAATIKNVLLEEIKRLKIIPETELVHSRI
ncbi:MAG: acetyl-CoA carboxylase carboxyl transferase subunit alpha, partial [Candidatus Marinimicrobia bacterium CG_4_9_14_3_um_filter_48_9]